MGKTEGWSKGKKYGIRQGQLFGPWGVGAILPCPDGSSVMIAGLDAFPSGGGRMRNVYDRRLTRYIGVKRLLAPPHRCRNCASGEVPPLALLPLVQESLSRRQQGAGYSPLQERIMQTYPARA